MHPRAWLTENGYGAGPAGRRLAGELRALGGPRRVKELTFAIPTSQFPTTYERRTGARDLRLCCSANPHAPEPHRGVRHIAGSGTADRRRRQPRRHPGVCSPELASDEDDSVRRAVAANVLSRPGLLAGLAEDKNEKIRIAVAASTRC